MLQSAQSLNNRIFLTGLFLLAGIYLLNAQTPLFRKVELRYEYASGKINTVFCDGTGLLWLGTSEGLLKTDGGTFTEFKGSGGKKYNVTAVTTPDENKTWFGTSDGEIGLIESNKTAMCFFEEGCPKKGISSIATDSNHVVWFGTRGEGVYYLWNNRLYNINKGDGLTDDYCYKTVCDKNNNIWVATDNGITVCRVENGKKKIIKRFQVKDGLRDNIIRDITFLNDTVLVAGMQDHGICFINPVTNAMYIPGKYAEWPYGEINKISIIKNQIWIATTRHGVVYDDGVAAHPLKKYVSFHGLKFERVYDITSDLQNNLWIVYSDGLLRSTGGKLQLFEKAEGKDITFVHQLLITKDGKLVFTPDQGLHIIPAGNMSSGITQRFEVTPPKDLIDIVSLCEDECGYIWIGTTGRGIYRLNPESGNIVKVEAPGIENATVLSLSIKNNFIWVAWLGGANKYRLPEDCYVENITLQEENFDPQKKAGDYYVYTVFNDSRNSAWIGTDGKGLLKISGNEFTFYTTANGLKSNVIYAVTEDRGKRIWCSNAGSGLNYFEGDSLKSFNETNGLSGNVFTVLTADRKGNILAAGDNGFDFISGKNNSVISYGKEWELTGMNVDLNSSAVFNNLFYIGTEKGILVYDPSMEPSLPAPSTIIENVFLPGKSVFKTGSQNLKHDENNLTFSIASSWPAYVDNTTFQYYLTGYSREWNTTRDKIVNFPSLPPGTYVFRVRSSVNRSFDNSPVTEFTFVINKPFWKELWFIVLCSLLIMLILFLYLKMRDESNRKYNALKNEKILFQFETLRNQVNPHFLFNSFNTLISIIDNDKEAAIEYVQKLSDFFRDVVSNKDKNFISLRHELELAETYFYLQKKRFGSNLMLELKVSEEALAKELPSMVLQLLIENAIKHNAISSETPLVISIRSNEARLEISNNKNEKRNKEPSTGTGLSNIINRYKLQTTEKVIVKENNEVFSVSIPLI